MDITLSWMGPEVKNNTRILRPGMVAEGFSVTEVIFLAY